MPVPVQAVLFLGIIPALILLYISLKGYEGLYKDKAIFLIFVIGIILGVIAAFVRAYLNPPALLLVYIALFAFFEQLIKTVVLNIGRLQRKKETTIYGLSMGLGFGSSFTPLLIIAGSQIQSDISFISLIAFGSIGFILFHAATGSYIGYGLYSGKLIKHLMIAIILQLPFNALADAARFYQSQYFTYYQIGLVVYGAILFWYVVTKIMPNILKKRKKSKK